MLNRRTLLTGAAGLALTAAAGRPALAAAPDLGAFAEAAKGQSLNLIVDPQQAYKDILAVFSKAYPDIAVQATVLHPSDAVPRLIREQENKLYAWDAWWGTCTNMNSLATPAGVLADLGDYLTPEILDPTQWRVPDMMFTSPKGKYVFVFNLGLINQGAYNTALVPGGALETGQLLDPALKGKICIRKPNRPHGGSLMLTQIANEQGFDYVEKLLRDQAPVYMDNDRLTTQAVMRGDMAVALGTSEETLHTCIAEGGCAEAKPFPTADMQARGLSIPNNPPNAAAAKLFANWMLSQEGQQAYVTEWAKTNFGGAHSLRKDVAPDPDQLASMPDYDNMSKYAAVSYDRGWAQVQQVIELYNKING